MKVLFLGDIVGRSGREALNRHLHKINLDNQIDFTIVNGENAAGGFGITEKTISNLRSADGLVVGSAICREITRSLKDRQNPVTNVIKLVRKLKKKII